MFHILQYLHNELIRKHCLSKVIRAESYFTTSYKSLTIFSVCPINLLSWISVYRCRMVPLLRYHITTGRGLILCRFWCRNMRKTKNMSWFWEMSEKKWLRLPSLLNCVCLKGIKYRYFLYNLQWHLQEFAGEKAHWSSGYEWLQKATK